MVVFSFPTLTQVLALSPRLLFPAHRLLHCMGATPDIDTKRGGRFLNEELLTGKKSII